METVAKRVKFGKRLSTSFVFCGIRFTHHKDGSIDMDQEGAIDLIALIEVDSKRADDDHATPAEVTQLRGRLGSVLYIAGNTRPFEAYPVSHLSGFVTGAKVSHLRQINKVIKHLKATKAFRLRYVALKGPLITYTFHDSNFKKERDAGSQSGSLTLIGTVPDSDGCFTFCLLRYLSRRARRVLHSTLAVETVSATLSLDINEGTRNRLLDVCIETEGVLVTDCHSLFDHVYAMTGKVDEMLVPDFYQLREACMPFRHALSPDFDGKAVELWWVPTWLQLADNLTKTSTPSSDLFMRSLSHNFLQLLEYKRPRKAHQTLSALWVAFENTFASDCKCEAVCECGACTGDHLRLQVPT